MVVEELGGGENGAPEAAVLPADVDRGAGHGAAPMAARRQHGLCEGSTGTSVNPATRRRSAFLSGSSRFSGLRFHSLRLLKFTSIKPPFTLLLDICELLNIDSLMKRVLLPACWSFKSLPVALSEPDFRIKT